MEYRQLGTSQLSVSRIGLGTMTWGEQTNRADAFAQLDLALDAGVTLVDTAELYPIPASAATYGATETMLGAWLAERRCRDRIVLATKTAGYAPKYAHIRGGNAVQSAQNLRVALEGSLNRLRTDVIDLYQIHWADRKTNFTSKATFDEVTKEPKTDLGDIIALMERFRAEGKIRHFGVSNETPWGLMRYLTCARSTGGPGPISVQNQYNVLDRRHEDVLAEVCYRERVSLIAYSPLAGGLLTGKYLCGNADERARYLRYPKAFTGARVHDATVERLMALSRAHGVAPETLAYSFLLDGPYVDVVLVGATEVGQLKTNLECATGARRADLRPAVVDLLAA